eukprot:scaffold528_cov165-Amphora_coffeaeformis.AAC.54
MATRDERPDLSRWGAFVETLQRDETAVSPRQTLSPRRGLRRQSTRSDDQTSSAADKPPWASRLPPLRGSGHLASFDVSAHATKNGSNGNSKKDTSSNENDNNNENNRSVGDAVAKTDENILNNGIGAS